MSSRLALESRISFISHEKKHYFSIVMGKKHLSSYFSIVMRKNIVYFFSLEMWMVKVDLGSGFGFSSLWCHFTARLYFTIVLPTSTSSPIGLEKSILRIHLFISDFVWCHFTTMLYLWLYCPRLHQALTRSRFWEFLSEIAWCNFTARLYLKLFGQLGTSGSNEKPILKIS